MTDEHLKSTIAQTYLAAAGHYPGRLIDCEWGPLSKSAARAWLVASRSQITARMVSPARRKLDGIPANETLRTLAAQIHLADLKLYTGHIDAWWGPLSKTASYSWEALQLQPDSEKPGHPLTPYDVARQHIGVREIPGKKHNPLIVRWLRVFASWISDDETAWCSAFVAHCAREAGYETEGSTLAARSWLHVGEKVNIHSARKGDVVIFWRGDPESWQGHVAFIHSIDRDQGTIRVLGGNQNNQVNLTTYTTSSILGIRRLRSLDSLQGPSNKI